VLTFCKRAEGALGIKGKAQTIEEAVRNQKEGLRQVKEANPISYGTGQVGGFLAPGALLAKGAQAIGKGVMKVAPKLWGKTEANLIGDVAVGAGTGGLQGLAESGGDLGEAGKGMAFGAALQPIGTGLSVMAGGVKKALNPERIREFADEKTLKHVFAGKKDLLRKVSEKDRPGVAKALREEIEPLNIFQGADDVLENIQTKLDDYGEKIGSVYKEAQSAGHQGIDRDFLKERIEAQLKDPQTGESFRDNELKQHLIPILDEVMAEIDRAGTRIIKLPKKNYTKVPTGILDEKGNPVMREKVSSTVEEHKVPQNITLEGLQNIKKAIDDRIFTRDQTGRMSVLREGADAAMAARGVIRDLLNEQTEKFLGSGKGSKALNEQFKKYATLEKALENARDQQIANKSVGLTDTITAASMLPGALEDPTKVGKMAGVMGLKRLAESQGNKVMGSGAEMLANFLEAGGERSTKVMNMIRESLARGVQPAVLHNILKEKEPEYQQFLQGSP